MDGPADIRCHQIVELVTDYLEGALDEADRTRFEMHIIVCRGCENYLEQMRRTADVVGDAPPDEPDPEQMEELLEAFRSWRRRTLEER
jgi:predicted anti-sigma-YlaC factor YlaD